jgi:exodeoxyribonuclease VII large subunit
MLNVLARRHESAGILVYPAQVQGEAASGEVAAGVKYFNRAKNVDVIVIARGGGSIEDLAAFNDEALARVIAASALPVISAVGHETDFTIADFVADLRAPTPSAAAELVIESKHRLAEHLAHLEQRLARGARYRLLMARSKWTEMAQHGAFARIQDLLARRAQRLDELVFRMATAFQASLREAGRRLDLSAARIRHFDFRRSMAIIRSNLDAGTNAVVAAMRGRLAQDTARLDRLSAKLDALSPVKILDRGYALIFDSHGALIKDAAQISPGSEISARVARGSFTAAIKETKRE